MPSLLSSPARLTDLSAIGYLKAHFCEHGVLGFQKRIGDIPLTELDKFRLVPLVFGLMPKGAYVERKPDYPIKPAISAHLQAIGVPFDALLLDVLKSVCDQFWETRKDAGGRSLKRKYGMRDVRANRRAYRTLRERQEGRCALCGVLMRVSDETLDHVVPFRLIGDVPDASNWSILCPPCNAAKGNFVSSLQAAQAHNWVYSTDAGRFPVEDALPETRFLVLAQSGRCGAEGCEVTARSGQLYIRKIRESGLAVADNLEVRCHAHRYVP